MCFQRQGAHPSPQAAHSHYLNGDNGWKFFIGDFHSLSCSMCVPWSVGDHCANDVPNASHLGIEPDYWRTPQNSSKSQLFWIVQKGKKKVPHPHNFLLRHILGMLWGLFASLFYYLGCVLLYKCLESVGVERNLEMTGIGMANSLHLQGQFWWFSTDSLLRSCPG